jgi:hypothetical protein
MLRKSVSVSLLSALCALYSFAQDKCPVKFGAVTAADFDISKLTVDTTSGAVILADVGSSSFEGNSAGWFSLVYKHQRRIRIINKNGFNLADVSINLYKNKDKEERLDDVKAITYNLENGEVVQTKLTNKEIFEDKYDEKHMRKKFTLPSVKEGSIIEYSYTISSDFLFNLQPWDFQGKYPRVWSEYSVDIPEYFKYVFLSQGYQPFSSKTESAGREVFSIMFEGQNPFEKTQMVTITANTARTRWVMQNVPAFKEENYISSIKNHISKIEFQEQGIQFPNEPYEDVMGDWTRTSKQLLEREDFGAQLSRNNGWLNDEMKIVTAGAKTDLDKTKAIYYYVRNNIKSTNEKGILTQKDLKDVFKNKNGTVAEVNLLLVAMLRHENINADPVILSTRENGYTYTIYPILDRYDYVICRASVDTAVFLLDATRSYLGFNKLPSYCYNDYGRVIDKSTLPVSLSPDLLNEPAITNIMLFSDSIAGSWSGNITSIANYYESSKIRDKISSDGMEEYKKKVQTSYPEGFDLANIEIKNLDSSEMPVEVDGDVKFENPGNSDVIYFNPVSQNEFKDNPLKAEDRKYPVEMPYPIDDMCSLSIEIPAGYEVDELPKSVKVTFNDTEGFFEYYISKNESMVTLHSHIKFAKATFPPEEYQDLRSFFDYIVKKNNEQIVFKKKNN